MISENLSRRSALRSASAFAALRAVRLFGAPNVSSNEQFAAIERGIGVRLGVAALDTGTGHRLSYRGAEPFAMCSTFKFLLVAFILKRVDTGTEKLSRRISYSQGDLLEYAPATRAHLAQGWMTVGELCAAAVELSDNTAADLLLEQVGGPAGLTRFIRSLGNRVTRLDRTEPTLNTALSGDPRDTTSPMAMVDSMSKILVGNFLSSACRGQLIRWMEQCSTGERRLRAGFPAGWRAGDKTGTGERGAIGDIAIVCPPTKAPILVAAYLMEGNATGDQRNEAIASVGRVVTDGL
jgi:beta-lactamase class A